MKDKVKQLAEQAGFVLWSDEDWKPEGQVIDWSSVYDKELEKFSELVIKDFVSRLKSDTNEWVNTLGITDQNEINKLYEAQLARQLDEEWYWAIK